MALINGIPLNWEQNSLFGDLFIKTTIVDEFKNQITGNNIPSPFELSPFGKDWDKQTRDYPVNEIKNMI